jgi:diguanylate cyclase (GGDEF)-like protein
MSHEPQEPQGLDLSRRFRWAYGVGLGVGSTLTVLATLSTAHDIRALRAHVGPGGDATLDTMTKAAWVRGGITVALLYGLWRLVLRPMADQLASERLRLQIAERAQRAVSARQQLTAQIHEALDMTVDEAGVHGVVTRSMAKLTPDLPAELLLADSSRAHMIAVAVNPEVGGPGCGVPNPNACPAVRRGRTTVFTSSLEINACPMLADRPGGPCSAVCVPVSAMGRNIGVLHITGPDGAPPPVEQTDGLSVVATQAGVRIGNLRSMARAQLQASTDGLTGLTNRRATTELLGQLLRARHATTVVMVDLDHFKELNDTYGHEAGDRALRSFAEVTRRSLRDDDVIGRWGGEEFLLALPGIDRHDAVGVLERMRAGLADVAARADLPAVTASFGVIDTDATRDLDDLVRLADEALLAAKAQGRDRIVVGPVVEEPDDLGVSQAPAR